MTADIKDLFAGGKRGVPQQQQMNLNIDVNSLPDMPCIKCGQKEFFNITRIKKLSRTVSPTGQEGNVNVNMLKCRECGWLFNPREWEDHKKANEKTEAVEEVINLKDGVKAKKEKEDDGKVLCRKCGVFYDKGEEHTCK